MSHQSQGSRDHHGTSQAQKNAPDRAGSRSRTVGLNQLDTDRRALIVVRQRGSQGWTALDSRQRGRRCASHHTARGGRRRGRGCGGCRNRLRPPRAGQRGLCLSLNAVVSLNLTIEPVDYLDPARDPKFRFDHVTPHAAKRPLPGALQAKCSANFRRISASSRCPLCPEDSEVAVHRRYVRLVPIGDKGMLGRLMSPRGSRENSDVQLAAACKGTASIKCVPLVDFGLVNSAPS